jgi:CRISPR/Cas system-associated exonuclease Cas4 (RecB family)
MESKNKAESFLDEIADLLIKNHGNDFEKTAVILPSKRSALFLKKALASRIKETFWAPTTFNFTELISLHHNEIILDKTTLSFELYQVYMKLEGNQAETFDQFYKWGEILLTDFNEIDLYQLDAKEVFKDLKNIHELESWNTEVYTEMQERYLGFWRKLAPLYFAFRDHLEKKGFSYTGATYKAVAKELKLNGIGKSEFSHVYFCGLNALSPSEISIIKSYQRSIETELIWDLDNHYANHPVHEAGHFYRTLKESHPELTKGKIPSNLDVANKKITIYQAPSNVAQAKITAQILHEISPIISYEKCAVVLPDSALLLPVLQDLPSSIEAVNVTMGFPLEKTELFSLLESILKLQENIQKYQTGDSVNFHYIPFLRLIKHPILRQLCQEEVDAIDSAIRKRNKVFINHEDIKNMSFYTEHPNLFKKWSNLGSEPIQLILDFLDYLQPMLKQHITQNEINLHAINVTKEALSKLLPILSNYPYIQNLSTFKKIFKNACSNHQLSFFGEPLSGLQIMGLLETRALDFENLIILSLNENILPRAKHDNSILPYDLKKFHALPGSKERDAVMANHFFRLIQRAQNVHLVYAPISDGFGAGEKSRFLLQLKEELKQAQIGNRRFKIPLGTRVPNNQVTKNDLFYSELEEYLSNKGLSVSALNKFIRCPLDFYYTYVCGLRDEKDVEEEIEDSSMGQIVHKVLEEIYNPFINQNLDCEFLKNQRSEVRKMTEYHFIKHLNQNELHGMNYLSKEIAITQIEKVLTSDINDLESGSTIQLLGTEEVVTIPFEYSYNNKTIAIKLNGTIDRIDKKNGVIRVIDYKTGSVSADGVKSLNLSDINEKSNKSLQLAYYCYLFGELNPNQAVTSWIMAVKGSKQLYFQGKIDGLETHGPDFRNSFKNTLIGLLDQIYDPNRILEHNNESNYCQVC